MTTITVYSPLRSLDTVLVVCLIYASVTALSVIVWTLAGRQLRAWLNNSWRLRSFNMLMAAVLVASLYPVLLPD